MRQAQTVADLVSGHREEVHTGEDVPILGRRADGPRFVLIEVHVASAGPHFIGIVGVGQRVTRPVERISKQKKSYIIHKSGPSPRIDQFNAI